MSTVLTNGIIIPDNGNRNWGGDLANNWNILDVNVGYMNDVKSKITTLENSVAENTANIQTNASNISALQTSKQDVIEDLETIRAGASSGATAVQPSALSNYVDLSSEQTITGAKTFSNTITVNKASPRLQTKSTTYSSETSSSMTVGDIAFLNNSGSFSSWILDQLRDNLTKRLCFRVYPHAGGSYKGFAFDESCALYPETANSSLGTSSNKWKTINGLNPGALSLPGTNAITIDTSEWLLNGTTIVYTPTVGGWLTISVKCSSANNYIIVSQNGLYNSCGYNASGYMRTTLPVYVGKDVEIKAVGDSWSNVRLFASQGNV